MAVLHDIAAFATAPATRRPALEYAERVDALP